MLITYMLQVTLCLAFFYTPYHLVLQKETLFQTNRLYLLSTLVISLILPLIRIYIQDLHDEASIISAPYVYVGSYLDTMNTVIVTPKPEAFPWMKLVSSIYLAGIIFLAYRVIISVWVILKIKRKGINNEISGQLCILSPDVKTPFSFFNTIYLPIDHQFTDDELKEIITHEKTHVADMHTLDILIMELACIGLWPSPMVYVYRKKLREIHEFIADAEVLKNTPWEAYASLLVAQKSEGLQHRLSNQLIYSQLKSRLIMMNKQRSFQTAKFKYFAIVPILLLSLLIFAFREKAIPDINTPKSFNRIYNLYEDGLKISTPLDSIMGELMNSNRDSSILIITGDKRYFLNKKEVKSEQLEQALIKAVENDREHTIYIYPPKHSKVEDLDKLTELEFRLHARFIYVVPKLNPDRADYRMKDTMPTTIVTAYNLSSDNQDQQQINTQGTNIGKVENVTQKVFQFVEEMPRFPGCEEFTKTSKSSDTFFGASHISPGSIRVSSGGQELKENIDYKVDYNTNQIRIINADFLKPGMPLNVSFNEDARTKCANDAMFKYIYSAVNYPAEDREKGNEGMVVVQFTIDVDGGVSNAKVVRGVSPGLDAEIVRVIYGMNELPQKWIPGRDKGKAVPVEFTLPFKFVLQQNVSKEIEKKQMEEVYTSVDEMPRFPGCEDLPEADKMGCSTSNLFKYLSKQMQYPEEDRKNGKQGTVFVQFIVSSDGSVSAPVIEKGVSSGIDEEVIRIINLMNDMPQKWIPGRKDGKVVSVKFTLPVKFVLPAQHSIQNDQEIKKSANDNSISENQNIEAPREIKLLLFRCQNPVNDLLKVEFFSWVKQASIFNESGQLMWNKKLDRNDYLVSIDVHNWLPGKYMIQGTNEELSQTTSFIVQH